MKKITVTFFLFLVLTSCGPNSNEIATIETNNLNNTAVYEENKLSKSEVEEQIFGIYCSLGQIIQNYNYAPETEVYKSYIQNQSDVNSQKMIMPKLLAFQTTLGIENKIQKLEEDSDNFLNEINILKEANNSIKKSFEDIRFIDSFDEYQDKIQPFFYAVNLIETLPDTMIKAETEYPLFNSEFGLSMCNLSNPADFWGETETNN